MTKLKDIERWLDNHHITNYRTDNNQQILVPWCAVGDNFYDYGEEEPKIKVTTNKFLYDDPRIILMTCEWCGRCAGW